MNKQYLEVLLKKLLKLKISFGENVSSNQNAELQMIIAFVEGGIEMLESKVEKEKSGH